MFLHPSIDAGCDHLRVVFGQQMGLSDQDIVALSGAHTLVSMIPKDTWVPSLLIINLCQLVWIFCSFLAGKVPQGAFWL